MTTTNHKGTVLKDHKKVGQKLIPPLMQLPNLKEMSFKDNTLPTLIWLSAIFLRSSDRTAVNNIIEFCIDCKKILDNDASPPLAFMNNFDKLQDEDKTKILDKLRMSPRLAFLRAQLCHQHHLLAGYPLSFLFEDYRYGVDRAEALDMLKEDVSALLDRYSLHATKVQTTVMISMTATGKLFFGPNIDIPDFNAVFLEPESDEGRRVASFVRANLNAGAGFQDLEGGSNTWSKSFWQQAFSMESCS